MKRTHASPAYDVQGRYEPTATGAMMDLVRDHLAQPTPDASPDTSLDTGEVW